MVVSCSAYGCTNRFSKRKKLQFHRFPHKNPKLLVQWLVAVKRKSWTPTKNAFLCGAHFSDNSYKSSARRYLKRGAVPSIFNFPVHKQKFVKDKQVIVQPSLSIPETGTTVAAISKSLAKSKHINKNVKYFCFPPEDRMRKFWMIKYSLAEKWNLSKAKVCSVHCTDCKDDFERDLQAKLLGIKPEKELKKAAASSILFDQTLIDKCRKEKKPCIVQSSSQTEPNSDETNKSVELPISSNELEEDFHPKLENLLNNMKKYNLENVSKNIESIKMQLRLLKAAGAEISCN